MKILLDTATFLWIVEGSEHLSASARELFSSSRNEVFLSSVSAWEIAVKNALGKLPLPELAAEFVPRMREGHGIAPLPLFESAALQLPKLPAIHRDPFDRMLVCQAIAGGLTLLTPDTVLHRYPVLTAW